ncbi:MAG: PilX N-terminal domain-containing pilus assembly protein, partial [Candidatus Gottesmanbacteria bacterium]
MKNNIGKQNGQILLIVLLVMVVGLTMGLSLATRSATDVKISSQLEHSSRAFAAAEAGIEAALKG